MNDIPIRLFCSNPAPPKGLRIANKLQTDRLAGLTGSVVSASTGTSAVTIDRVVEEIANFLTRQGYEFVSVDIAGPIHILAAQRGHFTLGVAVQPAPASLASCLVHAFERRGCNGLILVTFDLTSLDRLTGALEEQVPAPLVDRVGAVSLSALRLLLCA